MKDLIHFLLITTIFVWLVNQITVIGNENVCLNIHICKYFCSYWTNMSNFQSLEIVGRGSETQLQVGENFIKFTLQ